MTHDNGKNIAVVTQAVKLPCEDRGLDRTAYICQMLEDHGYNVTLITSDFQHWYKKHRDVSNPAYSSLDYSIVFLHEHGYDKNIDPMRIISHWRLGKELSKYFDENIDNFDLIWCQIPPNNLARISAEKAKEHNIKFIVDINDLWPEAMRMVCDVPVVSDIMFSSFERDADKVYKLADACVGTSDEYTSFPMIRQKDRNNDHPMRGETVYVGGDLDRFDNGVREHTGEIKKAENELWVTYAGTLGKSYDIETLIRAVADASRKLNEVKLECKILGDGPDRQRLEKTATDIGAPVDFLGYLPYDTMAAWLRASDILVNSLVRNAPQSIVSKIGDYLMSGRPMINTGVSEEFREKCEKDGFGVSVEPGNVNALSDMIVALAKDKPRREMMGKRARLTGVHQFDRKTSYEKIPKLIKEVLTEKTNA